MVRGYWWWQGRNFTRQLLSGPAGISCEGVFVSSLEIMSSQIDPRGHIVGTSKLTFPILKDEPWSQTWRPTPSTVEIGCLKVETGGHA